MLRLGDVKKESSASERSVTETVQRNVPDDLTVQHRGSEDVKSSKIRHARCSVCQRRHAVRQMSC